MRRKQAGQGIIEYAGAIVASVLLVAVVLAAGPEGLSQLFSDVLASAQGLLTGKLASISS